MSDNLRIYELKRYWIILIGLNIFFAGTASITMLFLPSILNKITAILFLVVSIIWTLHYLYLKNNIQLATTNEKIIISRGPIRQILEIDINNIEKIEKKSPTKFEIWYLDKYSNIRKQKLYLSSFKDEDQIEFSKYLEIIMGKKSPTV